MELRSLYTEFHFYLNSSKIWNFFWESILLILIIISMNLFDQLVILICDPVMEG